jgi:major vault protein
MAKHFQGEAAVKQAELKAQAQRIRTDAQLATKKAMMTQEVEYRKMKDKLEIDRAEKEAKIEAAKFSNVIEALGADTITAIARAGPELQAQLLEGLGLEGFLVTDGNSPVNLFGTAAGLLGGNASK